MSQSALKTMLGGMAGARRSPSQVTAIDFDGRVVRVAQVSHRGRRPKITHLAALDLPEQVDHEDAAACGRWLREALSELKIRPRNGVVMGVPRGQVMLKPLTLPMPEDPRELAGMVHFQVGKELPFPQEEAVVDFTIHRHHEPAASEAAADPDEEAGPTVEVLAAITRGRVVEHYRAMAEAAELKLIGLGLRSYANVRTVEACGVDNRQQAVALVSLRPDEVIIDVLVESRLAFSRMAAANLQGHHEDQAAHEAHEEKADETQPSAEGGNNDAADEEALTAAVTKEVVRSLHGYRVHPDHKEVGHVVVAGDTGRELAVANALAQRLGIPCHPIDPASDLGYRGEGTDRASAAIAAIGLGISATDRTGLPFDFLNPTQPTVKRDLRPLKYAAVVAALVLIVMGMAFYRVSETGERQQRLEAIREQVEDLRNMRNEFRRMQLHERNVNEWLEERRSWLDHYLYLSSVLPPSEKVYVSNFATTSGGAIRLNLHARSGDVLIELDRRLRDAGYVVKPLAVTPGNDPHGYNFRTTVELSIPSRLELGEEELEDLEVPPRPEDDVFRISRSQGLPVPPTLQLKTPLAAGEGVSDE